MDLRRINNEDLLFSLAFGLALVVRLFNLGAAPLSDFEAHWALQALDLARGGLQDVQPGPQPGYIFLTEAAFLLLGSANAIARLWPALAGSLLVLLPRLLRAELGRVAALILAFGLALDPGLAAASRLAGSPMLALTFSLFALALAYRRRMVWAGICAGLALLGGPAVLLGAVGLALAGAVTRWLLGLIRPVAQGRSVGLPPQSDLRLGLLAAGGTILLAGTLFLRHPQGLASIAGTLPAFLAGLTAPGSVPADWLLGALLFFQPLALIFGVVSAARLFYTWDIEEEPEEIPDGAEGAEAAETGTAVRVYTAATADAQAQPAYPPDTFPNRPLGLFLTLWAFAALLLALFYPARQTTDLVWVLLPLWGLAALELARYLPGTEERIVALGQAALVFFLLVLFWLSLMTLSHFSGPSDVNWPRYALLGGILILIGLTTSLVALGWSWEAARKGLAWGAAAILGLYVVSSLVSATQLRPNQPQELWAPPPGGGQAQLLLATLEDLSVWHTGFPRSLEVTATNPAPSLRWLLRDFPQARFLDTEPWRGDMPAVILTTPAQAAPALTAAYRGQDFTWWTYPGWAGGLPPNITRWLAFREAPLLEDHVILWARSDIFPGGTIENGIPLDEDLLADPPLLTDPEP